MHRRTFVIAAAGSTLTLAGCLGDDETYTEDASEYILPETTVSDILPGEWDQVGSRDGEVQPAGWESEEIHLYESADGDDAELGLMVMESIDDAETWMDDEWRTEDFEDTPGVDLEEADVGDEAFALTAADDAMFVARLSNVYIQTHGTVHVSNLRELAEEQIEAIEGS